MKKILFVINTLGLAGAEMALLSMLRCLKMEEEHSMEGGHSMEEVQISLYVLTGQGELADRVPEYVKILNPEIQRIPIHSKEGAKNLKKTVFQAALRRGNLFRNIPYLLKNLAVMLKKGRIWPDKLVWKLLSDGGIPIGETYDLAVAYLEGGSAYYVADYVKAKRKAAFIHIDYGLAGYTRELDQNCYLKYNRIFTVSEEVREQFLKVYPECEKRTEIFHNIIDRESILKRGEEPGGFTDDYEGIRILTVGRLNYQKAYDYAVRAMKLLKEDGYKARWYVLGEGDQRKALEKQIAEEGLTEDFLLPGAVDNPFPYYKQADIYVHATRFEGKSIAVQEAKIYGLPVLASDCSGNREQIEHGVDGLLCQLDPIRIKEGISLLLETKELRERLGREAEARQKGSAGEIEKLTKLLNEI